MEYKGPPHTVEQPPPYSAYPYPGVHQPYPTAPPPYQAPHPGFQPRPIENIHTYGATNITITPPIVVIGACPACGVGMLEDDYPCLALFCAIMFFPLGILCCLAMKNRHCSHCGAYFG